MICIRKGIMIFQEMTLDKQWGSKNFKVIAVGVILFFSLTLSQSPLIQAQGISPIRTADNTDDPVVDKDENGALYLDFKKVTLINVCVGHKIIGHITTLRNSLQGLLQSDTI